MRKRVLHLIPSLSGGGAERQLSYLAPELVRLGWEVHIGFLKTGPVSTSRNKCGVHFHKISHRGNYDPRILSRVIRLTNRSRPNVIQTWIRQMDIIGGFGAWVNGILRVF